MKFLVSGRVEGIFEANNMHEIKWMFQKGIDVAYKTSEIKAIVLDDDDSREPLNAKLGEADSPKNLIQNFKLWPDKKMATEETDKDNEALVKTI